MDWQGFWDGTIGTRGDYSYGKAHIISLLIIIALIVLFCFLGYKKSDKYKRNVLLSIAIFFFSFEMIWRCLYAILDKSTFWDLWPLFPCNLAGLLVPLAVIINNKTLKKMFYLFGFFGGVLTFAMPIDLFYSSALTFGILKSILQHGALLALPVIEYVYKTFRPRIKDAFYVLAGLLINVFNSEFISVWLNKAGDYMFFRSGLPFVIPGISQYITFSVLGLIAIYGLLFLLDTKVSREVLIENN